MSKDRGYYERRYYTHRATRLGWWLLGLLAIGVGILGLLHGRVIGGAALILFGLSAFI